MLFNSEHLDSGHNHAGMTPKQSPSGKICAAGADSIKVLNSYILLNRRPKSPSERMRDIAANNNMDPHSIYRLIYAATQNQ